MTEREDKVYKAKLAEQAERYDGEYLGLEALTWDFRLKNDLN